MILSRLQIPILVLFLVTLLVCDCEAQRLTSISRHPDGTELSGSSFNPHVSKDGRFVAFDYKTTAFINLDNPSHVFYWDRLTRETYEVSQNNQDFNFSSAAMVGITEDGAKIVFWGSLQGSDDIDVYLFDRVSGKITLYMARDTQSFCSEDDIFAPDKGSISTDARYYVFTTCKPVSLIGLDREYEIYIYDSQEMSFALVPGSTFQQRGGFPAPYVPSISSDGRYVAYANGVVFLYDTVEQNRVSVSKGEGLGHSPTMTPDGRYTVFVGFIPNPLSENDGARSDIFVYDRVSDDIDRISVNNFGIPTNAFSYEPDISDDGRYVTFRSTATNLVYGDIGSFDDLFVFDRVRRRVNMVSISDADVQSNGGNLNAEISGDGNTIVFQSGASNLLADNMISNVEIYSLDRTQLPIDVAAPPPTKFFTGMPPGFPPVVNVNQATVSILLQPIVSIDFRPRLKKVGRAVRYRLRIAREHQPGERKRRKDSRGIVTRRPQIILKRLRSGIYNANHRVEVKQGRRTKRRVKSEWSRTVRFEIK